MRLLVASLGVMVDGAGVAGADRGFFLGEHGELSVHGPLQRGRFRGGRSAGHGVSASDSAPAERARFAAARVNRRPSSSPRSPESLVSSTRSSLRAALDPLENRVLSKHVKTVFRLWVIVFALVGAQMGWVLRPFVGNPDMPFTWFRRRESNFFQAVLHTFQSLFS